MNKRLAASLALLVLGSAGSASAGDANFLPGSICHPTDPGGAAFNKSFHKMFNGSGAGMWVTCPLVRDTTNSIDQVNLYFTGTTSFLRLEIRTGSNGLIGWDPDPGPVSAFGGMWHRWFFNTPNGFAGLGDHAAVSVFLGAGSAINGLHFVEL